MITSKRCAHGLLFCLMILGALQDGLSLAQPASLRPRQVQVDTNQGYARLPDQHYPIPSMNLVRQDGRVIRLSQLLRQNKSILLTFIYTSCSSICPIMTRTMLGVQQKLGERASDIEMMSITLDPEYDRPDVLSAYAKEIGAGSQWWHYTGQTNEIAKLAKAFQAYTKNKMDHVPVFLLKPERSSSWIRYQGFVGSSDIVRDIALR